MNINELVTHAIQNGGGTYQRVKKNNYRVVKFHSGFLIGRSGGIDNLPRLRTVIVEDFLDASSYSIIGIWYDTKNATWSIDAPVHRAELYAAKDVAITNNQKAIWDCEMGWSVYV